MKLTNSILTSLLVMAQVLDEVRQLIQQVVRSFYDVRAVIVVDALLIHKVLSDRDLVSMMGLAAKDLRSVCARLKEDHLIKEVSHKDDASKDHRAYTQTFYYIHYTEAVDAIKWKMYSVENKLKSEMDAQHNPHGYVCDTCNTKYRTIDVLPLLDPVAGVIICDVCGSHLQEDEGPPAENGSSVRDRMSELNPQLQSLINGLRKLDELQIPENTFQSEQQHAVPLPSAQPEASAEQSLPIAGENKRSQPVGPTFMVHITSDAERQRDEELKAREKRRLAEENALPQWHVESTVDRRIFENKPVKAEEPVAKSESAEVKNDATEDEDIMNAYYKKLQEQQKNQCGDGDVGDHGEDEDEDEFEDIEV